MSLQASTNFKTEFDSLVKQDYQGGSMLAGKVRTKQAKAKTQRFPKMGKGLASLRIPQTDVIPMNVGHSFADATLVDWNAPEYSDILDLDKLAFDEKQELVKVSLRAMGRRYDQIIIDAMNAAAFATAVGINIGGTNTSLNVAKILRAKRLLDANGVPAEGRVMIINAAAMEGALNDTKIGSSDYNVIKSLYEGTLNKYAQFEFIMIEDRVEGGLPITGNTRTCFAFHKEAVGLAISHEIATDVSWIAEKTSWLINTLFSAGAVTIDINGVIKVNVFE